MELLILYIFPLFFTPGVDQPGLPTSEILNSESLLFNYSLPPLYLSTALSRPQSLEPSLHFLLVYLPPIDLSSFPIHPGLQIVQHLNHSHQYLPYPCTFIPLQQLSIKIPNLYQGYSLPCLLLYPGPK